MNDVSQYVFRVLYLNNNSLFGSIPSTVGTLTALTWVTRVVALLTAGPHQSCLPVLSFIHWC